MASSELRHFLRSVQNANYTRGRMESLYIQGEICKRDIDAVYEGLFLRIVTSFETYLEEMFQLVLLGRSDHISARAKLLMQISNKSNLRDILLQGKDYCDWLPYERTESRAKLYLRDGKPFTGLSNSQKSRMKEITIIRNAIAHKSDYATKKFTPIVASNFSLMRNEKYPAGFLRSQIRSSPRQVRFESYATELAIISQDISN